MPAKTAPIPNTPVRPIIVRKTIEAAHAAHHGGAWKIAYADFVTAMMAFFLLMWLLGMTDEQKRKGLADYFAPTLIEYRQESSGSNGILGGDSIIAKSNMPHGATQTGNRAIVVPHDTVGGPLETRPNAPTPESRFVGLRDEISRKLSSTPELAALRDHVTFTVTPDGLRIDLMDQARMSMFERSTATLRPEAQRLVRAVAEAVAHNAGSLIIRGHTDAAQYPRNSGINNWTLSAKRAEATRLAMVQAGVGADRFVRLEGAAERELLVPNDPMDPRNRRISITLGR